MMPPDAEMRAKPKAKHNVKGNSNIGAADGVRRLLLCTDALLNGHVEVRISRCIAYAMM